MYKIAFATLGCKVNQYDTDSLAALFKKKGYEIVDFKDDADVYVINTCTVTLTGDKKSRQMIRRAISSNPDALIVATGCYAQSAPKEVWDIDGVDIVTGTSNRKSVFELVDNAQRANREKTLNVEDLTGCRNYEEMGTEGAIERTRAYVKIQDGCDSFCSYCRVPYVRGRVRSRRPESIVEEVENLARKGIKEVILTGIHLSLYGKDYGFKPDLADVIDLIVSVKGIERIRLSSVDPADVTDKLIEVISKNDKVCNHLHMALQSGDDRILALMNRKYTGESFFDMVEKIRASIPDIVFTTDVIVGFPSEDDIAFENTMKLVKEVGFSKVHVFKYSKRKGTKAADYDNQVSPDIKDDRSQKLIALSNELAQKNNMSKIGTTCSVLIERVYASPKSTKELKNFNLPAGRYAEGVTKDYIRVFARISDASQVEDILDVDIVEAYPEFLVGESK